MSWVEAAIWLQVNDPERRLTFIQNEMIKSALARDDLNAARKYMKDFLKCR